MPAQLRMPEVEGEFMDVCDIDTGLCTDAPQETAELLPDSVGKTTVCVVCAVRALGLVTHWNACSAVLRVVLVRGRYEHVCSALHSLCVVMVVACRSSAVAWSRWSRVVACHRSLGALSRGALSWPPVCAILRTCPARRTA